MDRFGWGAKRSFADNCVPKLEFGNEGEVGDAVLDLGADGAGEEIAKRRQATQQYDRPVLDLAVGLRERREGDVAFVHGRRSAAVVFAGVFEVVRGTGLEPARLSPYAPQTYVSANSTTRATV
jgi:hypothetical protein